MNRVNRWGVVLLAAAIGLTAACARAEMPKSLKEAVARPEAWFATDEGRTYVDNLLSYQTPAGGWAKAYDPVTPRRPDGSFGGWNGSATIDNGATHTELRILARAYAGAPRPEVLAAFDRGIDGLMAAQYPNGGWPQRWPVEARSEYGRHVTFNDNAMTSVVRLMFDVSRGAEPFAFVDADRRAKAKASFDRGIDCILKCQVVRDGRPTGWCAQHDADTLAPTNARSYELASLSGSEGAQIAILLMQIESPDDRVRRAVDGAAAWFERSKVSGKRIDSVPDPARPGKMRKVLVDDRSAPAMWARFYDLDTNKPYFCNRDGVKLWNYEELDQDRSMGYAWWGNWGDKVAKEYAAWQKRNPK